MGDGHAVGAPKDDDDFRFLGPIIDLRYALAQSRNVVAVKLMQQIGVDRVIEYAHRMGVRAPLEANLSLALGSSVVSPLDQAAGYATLADQGIHIDPLAPTARADSFGTAVLDNRVPAEQEVVSAGTAYLVTSMLEGVIKEGTGFPNAEIGRPAAGKTGTTSNFRDAWFVGFTPDLVTAVWLGNDDYRQMTESFGGNVPARTWARFMKAALAKTPKHDFAYPRERSAQTAVLRPDQEVRILPRGNRTAGLRLRRILRLAQTHGLDHERSAGRRRAHRRDRDPAKARPARAHRLDRGAVAAVTPTPSPSSKSRPRRRRSRAACRAPDSRTRRREPPRP